MANGTVLVNIPNLRTPPVTGGPGLGFGTFRTTHVNTRIVAIKNRAIYMGSSRDIFIPSDEIMLN